jgi:branched-chain amino acid transport system ATP-binding protein
VSDQLLRVHALHAGYRNVAVVRDLDIDVRRGEVVAMLGPNGAGKSTTLLTIAGVLPAQSGQMELVGRPMPRRAARSGVVLVPDDRGLFAQLTVADNLKLAARSRTSRLRDVFRDVFDVFPALEPLLRRRVGLLSGGDVRRPRLLLLDEMSLGLAPQLVARLLAVIRTLADRDGVGVLLVEQHAALALDVADRVLVLRHGELALAGPAAQVRQQAGVLEHSYLGGLADAD